MFSPPTRACCCVSAQWRRGETEGGLEIGGRREKKLIDEEKKEENELRKRNYRREDTKMETKVEEIKTGQSLILAVRVGLCEVYSPSALLLGFELTASVWVNRIGMLLQGQRNQHQLPLIQKP